MPNRSTLTPEQIAQIAASVYARRGSGVGSHTHRPIRQRPAAHQQWWGQTDTMTFASSTGPPATYRVEAGPWASETAITGARLNLLSSEHDDAVDTLRHLRDMFSLPSIHSNTQDQPMPMPLSNGLALPTQNEAALLANLLQAYPDPVSTFQRLTERIVSYEGIIDQMRRQIAGLEDQMRIVMTRTGGNPPPPAIASALGNIPRVRAVAPSSTSEAINSILGAPIVQNTRHAEAPAPAVQVTVRPDRASGAVPAGESATVQSAVPTAGAAAAHHPPGLGTVGVGGNAAQPTVDGAAGGNVTVDQLRAAVTTFSQRFGVERARALVTRVGGATTISGVAENQRFNVLCAIQAQSEAPALTTATTQAAGV